MSILINQLTFLIRRSPRGFVSVFQEYGRFEVSLLKCLTLGEGNMQSRKDILALALLLSKTSPSYHLDMSTLPLIESRYHFAAFSLTN